MTLESARGASRVANCWKLRTADGEGVGQGDSRALVEALNNANG